MQRQVFFGWIVGSAIAFTAFGLPAAAQPAKPQASAAPAVPEPPRSACGEGTPEQSIAACTASLARGDEPPPRRAGMLILRGEAYRQLRQVDRAHADFTASLQIMPTFRAHYGRGIIAVDRNEHEAGLADLNAADRITRNNFELLGYRALAHQGRGDLAWALADFEASIRNGGSSLAILVEERDRVRAQLAQNPVRSIGVDDAAFGGRLMNALTAAGLPVALRDDNCVQPRCRWRIHAIPGVVITTVRGTPDSADLRQVMLDVASSVHGNTAGRVITLMMQALSPTTSDTERVRAAMALAPNGDPMTAPPSETRLAGLTWRRERNVVTVGLSATPVQAAPQAPAAPPAAPADPLVGEWFWTGARPTQRGGIVVSASATPGAYVASFHWDMDGQRSGTSQWIIRQPDGTLRFNCISGQCYRPGVETVATGRLRADGGLLEMFIHENGRLATNLEYRRTR